MISDNFYCIFWTADSFAIKFGLIAHYHEPECFYEKLDCYVQGEGHSKILKCQWMFVQMIFSESLNLVWLCIIMSQIVCPRNWFAVFKVKVTVKDNIIKIWLFNMLSELLNPFATKLGLMVYYRKVDCLVKRLDCSVVVKVKVTEKVQNSSEYSSGRYFLSCWTVCN